MFIKAAVNKSHMLTILFLGFSAGLPLALSGSTLQAWYAVSGVDIITIGFLSLASQPYVYKFLWAPFFDRFTLPWLTRRRAWVLLMQVLLCGSIFLLGSASPAHYPWWTAGFALLVAFCSASQDIAIDAYQTDLLTPTERGLGVAMYSGGYRLAMLLSGGVALVLADYLGWRATFYFLAAFMAVGIVAICLAPEPSSELVSPQTLRQAVVEPFREFLSREKGGLLLLFIVLFKLGDAFTNAASGLTTTFFIRELGFTLTEVGVVNKGVGLVAILSGVFVGGVILSRVRLFTALLWFGVLQGASNAAFLFVALTGKRLWTMAASVFIENFTSGLVTAAFIAFLMSLCNKRFTATQYALLSAVAALGRVFSGPIGGAMIHWFGWINFFIMTIVLAVPGVVLLLYLKPHLAGCDITQG